MEDTFESATNYTGAARGEDIKLEEGATAERDPLSLDLDDEIFIKRAKKLVKDSEDWNNEKLQLKERRERNKKYLFGKQLDKVKFKEWQAKFEDNIIYEAMSYVQPTATSRMPTIVVKPGTDSEESKETAKSLSKVVTNDIQTRDRKRVLSKAYLHRYAYLIGAIKPFWNPQKGRFGDYDFRVVHPENLVLDHKAASNDAKDMDFIAENIEWTVKEWVMHFPAKEQAFYAELRKTNVFKNGFDESTEEGLNSKVKGWEIHFTHYEKKGDSFQKVEAVGWYYNDLVLAKMKTPNWDWTGEEQTFKYDTATKQKTKLSLDELMSTMDTAFSSDASNNLDQIKTETVYKNYLDAPEKPYIFLGYEQWGENPLDETTSLEQVILLQDNYNKRGRQVTETIDRSRGKNVFSSDSGLKKSDLEDLDMSDPSTDILIKGKVNEMWGYIKGEQPNAAMIQDKTELRNRIFDKMGAHGPLRGEVDMGAPATNNQISREGDFSRQDNVVDDTITYAAEKMARWELQFIKLRYSDEHFKGVLGEDGNMVFERVHRDMVEDGMEVIIGASGTDKLKAEQKAIDMAKLKLIDPYSFYKDIGADDPKGRTKRLLMFMDPNMRSMYLQDVGIDIASAMSGALGAVQPGGQPGAAGDGASRAMMDIAVIQQGSIPPVPTSVDVAYLQTFTNFMKDPQGAEAVLAQFPQIKDDLLAFASQITALAQQGATQQTPPPVGNQVDGIPANGAGGAAAIKAGPLQNTNPSPQNTQAVAAIPAAKA